VVWVAMRDENAIDGDLEAGCSVVDRSLRAPHASVDENVLVVDTDHVTVDVVGLGEWKRRVDPDHFVGDDMCALYCQTKAKSSR
jgi:hypothetical protein